MKITAPLLLGLTILLNSPAGLAAANEPSAGAAKINFLVIYRPGPGWVKGKTLAEQPLREHGKYMLSLYEKGTMKMAGPLTDEAGGAVLLEVDGEAAAKAIVLEDPAVKAGIFVYEMHPWELKPWEKYIKKN